MARRLFSLLCVAIILVSSVRCNNGGSTPPEKLAHKALFVLGDSLFDPGNNIYLSNYVRNPSYYRPYGETYFRRPVGRASDGRLVPDFIAKYAKLPLCQPYLKPGPRRLTDGANFASAGGGVLYQPNKPAMDLPQQMSHFREAVNSLKQELGEKEAKRVLRSAVYLFSIGGNDYFGLSNITASAQEQFVEMVIGNLTSALKEVYSLGGRKIAFQNVGPLGCTPSNRALNPPNGRCTELLLALARRHNRDLSSSLKKLESTLPGFKYSIFDYYNSLLDLINNPSKYGFKEGRAACCGSGPYRGIVYCAGGSDGKQKFETCSKPSEYVWFDAGHTTERANVKLAELIWNGPPHITGPYTVKQLFEFA